jgi:osmoprotectant transport system ATP-binding protein
MLAQYDTPEEILAHPASEFVERFVGADRGLKRLALRRAGDAELDAVPVGAAFAGPRCSTTTTLRDALSLMLTDGAREALVLDEFELPLGVLTLDRVSGLLRAEVAA